ncbi:MAG: KpsF/GutQ family sugar-phosphate isomerase [candidate division KSB1 bacterium]|nr:KpsF/GutQ family sugar-phosphate isomerase [candidate division KSB1 bacterium]
MNKAMQNVQTNADSILQSAKTVFDIESRSIALLTERIGDEFVESVNTMLACSGRVIVTGIGKSGLIGKKVAATLSSTGTPAFFLHPADASHGDLGMVTQTDVVLCLSKSGNTDEISAIVPVLKKLGVVIITMTGNLRSALAERSDIVLDVGVENEACPNDLAPTASTSAMLAMGDALAVALVKQRNFNREDFAFLHPGGSVGKQFIKIDEIMFTNDFIPVVHDDADLRQVVLEMSTKRFGGTCVVDKNGVCVGIITDGDLRRLWVRDMDIKQSRARDIMHPSPKTVSVGTLARTAFEIMSQHNIMQIIVVNAQNRPVGMVHLHDLLESGIGKL